MAEYLVIDADSHVEEPEEAWNYLQEKYRDRRPFPTTIMAAHAVTFTLPLLLGFYGIVAAACRTVFPA